jgi:hypothetical protein
VVDIKLTQKAVALPGGEGGTENKPFLCLTSRVCARARACVCVCVCVCVCARVGQQAQVQGSTCPLRVRCCDGQTLSSHELLLLLLLLQSPKSLRQLLLLLL